MTITGFVLTNETYDGSNEEIISSDIIDSEESSESIKFYNDQYNSISLKIILEDSNEKELYDEICCDYIGSEYKESEESSEEDDDDEEDKLYSDKMKCIVKTKENSKITITWDA